MAGPALFLTLDYPPMIGGVANYYSQLVQHLPADSVVVVDNHTQALTRPWLKTWFVLWRYRRSHQFSAIVVGQVLPLGTVAWLWHLIFGTPYIVYTHGMDITVPQRYARKRWLLHHILRRAAAIVTVSHYSQAQLQKLLPAVDQWSKITIIPPSPTITPAITAESLPQSLPPHFMLSVGRLVYRKGFDLVLHALASAAVQLPEWHYVIAGSGPEQVALMELVKSLKLNDRVHFFKQVSNGQLRELYEHCAFLVMPTRETAGDFEGFGTVILEANTFGKPAVGSRAGGMPDAILDERTGVLVPPDQVSALAQAITRLATDAVWRTKLGRQAQHYVQTHHQWATKAQQFHALLKQL